MLLDVTIGHGYVVLIGVGTVFIGLVCIILLLQLMHLIVSKFSKKTSEVETGSVPTSSASSDVIENREEIIAAISAAVAEELGTDVSAIRILSFKKIN